MLNRNILIMLAATMFLFTALFLFAIRNNGGMFGGGSNEDEFFNFKDTELNYFEYMYDDPVCRDGNCVKEYIVHSNGIVFSRNEFIANGSKRASTKTALLSRKKAEELIKYTRDHMEIFNPEGINCYDCGLVHIFYGDQLGTKSTTSFIDQSPQATRDIFIATEAAISEAIFVDPFFVHIVFNSLWGDTDDYHFYYDGTVLKEVFGDKNGELLSFNIYSIEKNIMDEIKTTISDDYFSAIDNDLPCIEEGLKWGYVEIQKGSDYNFVYTCGAGDSAADKLFKDLLKRIKHK